MARSRISGREIDLQKDNGSVLWSFIQGEQLAYNVTFDWIDNLNGMIIEAAVVESDSIPGALPTNIKPNGVQEKLQTYTPPFKFDWVSGTAYNKKDLVAVPGIVEYYQALTNHSNNVSPELDVDNWKIYGKHNIVTLVFPDTLSTDYEIQPEPDKPIYAYFELSLTEAGTDYNKSWKPMRGLIEFLFSPTQITA